MQDAIATARLALSLMDLTSLNVDDSGDTIRTLCAAAGSDAGIVAAVCVYPRLVAAARQALAEYGVPQVRVATVVNFPHGDADVAAAAAETHTAIAAGADEVDVVFPYRALLAGEAEVGAALVAACKAACGERLLKVIIESGELATPERIRQASDIALAAGADFLKTSTGKVAVNATPQAARIMLQALRDSGRDAGFKAAGGVRTLAEAAVYLQLAAEIMGEAWLTPAHFRFGASGLLANLQAVIRGQSAAVGDGY
ncbi:deoxyribose-phosphate aldolase [Vogesella oryzae]|uniref:deoxyribose-phosphate aldolase n=1 Tax=Vogesella oryzae TaxID=1735285 RepID=UPI00158343DE|nr:deoxyribose-phosphate aldolase [Vogesella oryzae]